MSDLRELYQEVILDHGKRPRNFRAVEGADRTAEGYNPLCGDKVTVYAKVAGDVIEDLAFQGAGCAISTASASMMTTALKGKSVAEAERVFARFHRLITGTAATEAGPATAADDLGDLVVLGGVRAFPMRVKCASLAWHTLRAALHGGGTVSTEE
jgi:nitrogen fixation NifU-like protein